MSGADVVALHSKSLQGQPAEQFSSIWYWVSFNINSYLLHRGNWAVVSWNCSNNRLHILDFRCSHECIFRAWYCFHLYTDSNPDFLRSPLFNVSIFSHFSLRRLCYEKKNLPDNCRLDCRNLRSHQDNWARKDNLNKSLSCESTTTVESTHMSSLKI